MLSNRSKVKFLLGGAWRECGGKGEAAPENGSHPCRKCHRERGVSLLSPPHSPGPISQTGQGEVLTHQEIRIAQPGDPELSLRTLKAERATSSSRRPQSPRRDRSGSRHQTPGTPASMRTCPSFHSPHWPGISHVCVLVCPTLAYQEGVSLQQGEGC